MNSLLDAINDFRRENGRPLVIWESWIIDRCFFHSRDMALGHCLYHAPYHFLDGLREAVCYSHVWLDQRNMLRYLVYEILGKSYGHRAVLLECSHLGGQDYIFDNSIYLTIRGR